MARPFLGLPRLPEPVEEERHEVDGFVGVVVVVVPEHVRRGFVEELREVAQHGFAPAHERYHALDVVRHEPSLLIGVRLDAAVPLGGAGVLGPRLPRSVGAARAEPALLPVEDIAVGLPFGGVEDGVFPLAQLRGQARDAPVGIGVFERVRNAQFRGGVAQRVVAETLRGVHGIAVGLLDVVAADALGIGVGQYRQRRVTQHAARVGVDDLPALEIAAPALIGHRDERIHEVADQLRVDDGLQRHLAAEHVPAAEDRAFGEPASRGMDSAVRPRVAPVGVGVDAGVDHRVVERRVEDRLLPVAAPVDADARQLPVPQLARLAGNLVERLAGDLGLEILSGALHVDERDARTKDDLLVLPRPEFGVEADVPAFDAVDARDDGRRGYALQVGDADHLVAFAYPVVGDVGAPEPVVFHRLVHLRVEIDRIVGLSLAVAPAARGGGAFHPPGDGVLVHHLDVLPLGRAADAARQVDLDARLFALGKGEAQDAAVRGGRTFGTDAVVGQQGAVIPRARGFRGLVVMGTVTPDRSVLPARDLLQRAGRRHDQQVAQVAEPAHAAHLREGEPFDGRVLVAVPGAVVPARDGVGADLHHTVGSRRPGEGLAQPVVDTRGARAGARPDEGVHVVGRREAARVALRGRGAAGEPHGRAA